MMARESQKGFRWWILVGAVVVIAVLATGAYLLWRNHKSAANAPEEDFSAAAVSSATINALVVHVQSDRLAVKQLGTATTQPKTYTVKITPQTVFTSLENPQTVPTIADVKENHAIDIHIVGNNLDTATVTAKEIVIF